MERNNTALHAEWVSLQRSIDQSEAVSIYIKLLAILLFLVSLALETSFMIPAVVIAVLWLQDAIWKTFQSRTEDRMLTIEKMIVDGDDSGAFQFYTNWQTQRPSLLGLLMQYLSHGLKPTVAYPYVVLLLFLFVFYISI